MPQGSATVSPSQLGRLAATPTTIRFAVAFLCVSLAPLVACRAAEVTIRFPLEGRYREGRYMPVRVDARDAGPTVRVDADGAVSTEIRIGDGATGATVPLLSTGGAIANARWRAGGGASGDIPEPPKPLAADERLVAFAGAEPSAATAAELFPGMKIVSVRLDATRRLAPAVAYESLDALVLGEAVSQSNTVVGESELRTLLAAGVIVAVQSDAAGAPDGADPSPWRRRGALWVLHHAPAGPSGTVAAEAYEPTYGWPRGWPRAVRLRAVLLVAVASIAATAAGLWRSRWAVALSAGVSLLGAGGIALWAAARPPIARVGGTILVRGAVDGESFTQRDRWTYHLPLRDAETSVPLVGLTRPVFFGRRQIAQLRASGMFLACDADGTPTRHVARLEAGTSLAFLRRSVEVDGPPPGTTGERVTSQLFGLANRTYPGRVLGQIAPEGGDDVDEPWRTVVVEGSAKP